MIPAMASARSRRIAIRLAEGTYSARRLRALWIELCRDETYARHVASWPHKRCGQSGFHGETRERNYRDCWTSRFDGARRGGTHGDNNGWTAIADACREGRKLPKVVVRGVFPEADRAAVLVPDRPQGFAEHQVDARRLRAGRTQHSHRWKGRLSTARLRAPNECG